MEISQTNSQIHSKSCFLSFKTQCGRMLKDLECSLSFVLLRNGENEFWLYYWMVV